MTEFRRLLETLPRAELLHRLEMADHELMQTQNMLNLYNERSDHPNALINESFERAEKRIKGVRDDLRSPVAAFLDGAGSGAA